MGVLPMQMYQLGKELTMDKIDWPAIWELVWPILKEGLIALLIAVLALLGYDKYIPSRYVRRENEKEEEG
jgi:hypothetical protein